MMTAMYDEIQVRVKPHCRVMPHLKILRVLTAFFPSEFTTLSDRTCMHKLKTLMFGRGRSEAVGRHLAVRARLDDVLGAVDPSDIEAVVARLTLSWMLFAYATKDERDVAPPPIEPGPVKLMPLPATRRRRGLTAIKGSFAEMLSILEFISDAPTREELLDYLRAQNPNIKESSAKMTINVLKSEFAVIQLDGGEYSLTDRGEAVLESGSSNELADWLLTRVLGVDNLVLALQKGPIASAAVDGLLQKVNPGWTTTFAPRALVHWLRNLGVIERDEAGMWSLTSLGLEWAELIDWEPECLPAKIDEPVNDKVEPADVQLPDLDSILAHIESEAAFPAALSTSLHFGLWATKLRHFAILTGLSGSGKTKLACAYGAAIIGDAPSTADRLCVLPVQPGWYDPTPLFGYVNPLSRDSYESTPFLELLLRASQHPSEPHVVVLDEMNLSHPEQYLAPVLSAMETGGELYLHSKGDHFDGIPSAIPYPNNLVLIGTVNMDETTLGISDKVLDRAFTLEFWDIDLDAWSGWSDCGLTVEDKKEVQALLRDLMQALKPARLHFGWRVLDEVIGFLRMRGAELNGPTLADALDRAVYAKILPKLRGEDSPRFRTALVGCEAALKSHGLTLSREKVIDLQSDLETFGSARFWR
jgi:hypothetical protein